MPPVLVDGVTGGSGKPQASAPPQSAVASERLARPARYPIYELRHRGFGARHRLPDLEALELRMVEVEWLVLSGILVRHPERLGPGPGLERRLALPDRMRRIERVLLGLRPLEQMELNEARHLLQLRVAVEPDGLESFFRSALHAKPIHGDRKSVV